MAIVLPNTERKKGTTALRKAPELEISVRTRGARPTCGTATAKLQKFQALSPNCWGARDPTGSKTN
ncbi:MAG: hypothetical protein FWH37_07270 [Candidatus Bathyarchaeota archaeon]|nr:hypothetical protein [Candidatus Termiticorpusculum sp.]